MAAAEHNSGRPSQDGRHPSLLKSPFWLAMGLAATVHLLWMAGLHLRPPGPVAPAMVTPRVGYLPVRMGPSDTNAIHADVRALWSPALFSLPTPMGFSRPARAGDFLWRPVFALPPLPKLLLEREALTEHPAEESEQDWPGPVDIALPTLVFSSLDPPALPVPADGMAGRLAVQLDGKPVPASANVVWPEQPWMHGTQSWEVVATITLANDGRVEHAFLETRTASEEFNRDMVVALLRWRLEPSTRRSARLVIRYSGWRASPPRARDGEKTP